MHFPTIVKTITAYAAKIITAAATKVSLAAEKSKNCMGKLKNLLKKPKILQNKYLKQQLDISSKPQRMRKQCSLMSQTKLMIAKIHGRLPLKPTKGIMWVNLINEDNITHIAPSSVARFCQIDV